MEIKTVTFEDKQNLNTNPEIARINKVTDEDINELKDVVNTNANNIGDLEQLQTTDKNSLVGAVNEITRNILWENSSIGNMPSGTQINLNSSDYDFIIWVFSTSVTGSTNNMSTGCLKGNNCVLIGATASTNISVRRQLNYVNDTQYQAQDGYGNSSVDNNNAIPVMAIGVKLVN